MAGLDELKKRIYRPNETFTERLGEPSLERLERQKYPLWAPEESMIKPPQNKKRFYWILAGVIAVVLAATLIFILFVPATFFETENVNIQVHGPSEIQSGERVSWTVDIRNSDTFLDSASIVFNFPTGAMSVESESSPIARQKRELGSMQPRQSISQTFDAYVFGGRDQKRSVSALIEYKPSGSSATLMKTVDFPFVIVRSPIALSLDMPNDLRTGQNVSIKVRYVSQSDQPISNLGITATVPDGFEIVKTTPEAKKNSNIGKIFWKIGNLNPSVSGFVDINGVIRGSDLDSKSFNVVIGIVDTKTNTVAQVFDEVTMATILHAPFLEVSLEAPSFVGAGRGGTVNVKWRNNLPVEVRDPILEITPVGDALDIFSLKPAQGSFKDSFMIWNSSTYPQFHLISPGASGEVSFSFNTKSNLARTSEEARPSLKFNAVFHSTGQLSGFEGVDINGADSIEIKISTKFAFTAKGAYFSSPISNTGPLPPKVGRETTYTIVWSFANMSNDVNNVIVRADIPPYVKFKNIINPSNADIRYDENTGFVVWNVGKVLAGTGFVRPAMQAAFQVGITPLALQEGQSPDLVSQSEATGVDSYTGETINLLGDKISTDMKDDRGVTNDQVRVVQ